VVWVQLVEDIKKKKILKLEK